MGELTMDELHLPALFEQARKLFQMRSWKLPPRGHGGIHRSGGYEDCLFKRQRAAESKLLEPNAYIAFAGKRVIERTGVGTAALSAPVEAGDEDTLDDDGEEERDAWLITVSLAICKALDLLEMLKKEEEMLSAEKEKELKNGDKGLCQGTLDDCAKKAEAWHGDAAVRAEYFKPAQPITCATFAQDVIEGRALLAQAHEHNHQPVIFGPASLVNSNLCIGHQK